MEPNPSNYSYNCVKCGNCCREGWYIPIFEEDLLAWEKSGKTDLYEKIQIDPRSISIIGMNFNFGRSEWDENFISIVKKNRDKCNEIIDTNKLKRIYDFVFDNHDYIGEGRQREHPVLGDIYEFPKPHEWAWPIFIPNKFQTISNGIKFGLNYIAITDLTGECEFLDGNSCSIHEIKPVACKKFPYREIGGKWQLDLFDGFVKVCKGLKKD